MAKKVELSRCYSVSGDVVAREVEEQIIIVQLVDGIGNIENELYSLNKTGKAVWKYLDGKTTLKNIIGKLSAKYDAQPAQIETDIKTLIRVLLEKGILIETTS